jgi:hypothetical protein
MSTLVENFTHEIFDVSSSREHGGKTSKEGLAYSEVEKEKRNPDGKKKYRPHLATKVKWALEDSMQRLEAAEKRMENILSWLEETHKFDIDERGQAHLGKLELELFALALDVSKAKEIVTGAIAESKPAMDAK